MEILMDLNVLLMQVFLEILADIRTSLDGGFVGLVSRFKVSVLGLAVILKTAKVVLIVIRTVPIYT